MSLNWINNFNLNMSSFQHPIFGTIYGFQKPYGISTHSVDHGKFGFKEWCEFKLKKKLYPLHRLDKETSGLILMAEQSQGADFFRDLWQTKSVAKVYLAIVKNSPKLKKHFIVSSYIDKNGGVYTSTSSQAPNAKTEFEVIQENHHWALVRAQIHTGKTHQIRLHLSNEGFPILGDITYGGFEFSRMCLHSHQVQISHPELPNQIDLKAEPPDFFRQLDHIHVDGPDRVKCDLSSQLHYRFGLQGFWFNTQRVHHHDEFCVDKFGSIAWVYDYRTEPASVEIYQVIFEELKKNLSVSGLIARKMLNRGQKQETPPTFSLGETHKHWTITEGNHLDEFRHFEMRSDCGLSPGLFLDQRNNRNWVQKNSNELDVLNLFSYTGGFSIAAALGKAKSVTTVDTSSVYIEWSKKNFILNELDPKLHEFWVTDCLLFLKGAIKKGRKFDLIICDPPSMGRSKEGIFKLESDWKELFNLCGQLLNRKGHLLFCHNLEKWTNTEWKNLAANQASKLGMVLNSEPLADLDFEQDLNLTKMKTILMEKTK